MIVLFYLSGGLAFLLGVSQIINSFAKRNWILSCLFFSMSFYLIKGICLLTGALQEYSHFFLIEIFVTLSVGPLLYLYFNLLIEDGVLRKKRIYLNFIPAILYLLFWGIHTLRILFQHESFRDLDHNYESRYTLLYTVVPLSPAIYVFILARKYYLIFRNNFFKEKWPIHIQIIFILAMISCAIGILLGIRTLTGLDRDFFERLYFFLLILLSGIVFYTFFISQKFPITFNIISNTIKQIQYEKTTLKKVDVSGVEAKIKSLMENEKIYQDEDLSLKSLSERLSMTPHQLSEFLNVKLNMNFNSLVNFYRVEEAKRLLTQREDLIILNVAYESGFNSLSAFHTAFKKHVGVSPNAFRKQILKNEKRI
ncbi:AraC family transcriptional regulator [Leptospira sp. FAT2]|uniref:helix-turn-helix domain-containing protein n=1 Tax=Leptospira sanjuanensis TaxID=2879643 RepID=UPI001EE81D10|nr:helix-turn-helix domain-containing protein [Leptospira sanjuanensis]MCG6168088.1 AraC family transcriptional regulator [Leptospira sanjuanensis]MCG6193505.1 AraC family transcriptional regulator [Leptospira sanjuanensis]